MIEIYYIVALAMSITNVYKHKVKNKSLIPILSFVTAIVLNILNSLLYNGSIQEAIKDAFVVGGVTIGLFNVGTVTGKAIRKPKHTE